MKLVQRFCAHLLHFRIWQDYQHFCFAFAQCGDVSRNIRPLHCGYIWRLALCCLDFCRCDGRHGPVTFVCRPKCSFKPLSASKATGFFQPSAEGLRRGCMRLLMYSKIAISAFLRVSQRCRQMSSALMVLNDLPDHSIRWLRPA